MMRISCIIPAYNEEKNIKQTIQILLPLLEKQLSEIIIINDDSKDKTTEILTEFSSLDRIKIITNIKNLGKSKSVARGIYEAKGDFVFFLDADLLHLQTSDIQNLLNPILEKKADRTMSFCKNSWPLWPFKKIDYCSGQRVISRELLLPHADAISQLASYGLEVFLNKILIREKQKLQVIHRPQVENTFHHDKDGRYKGRKRNLKIWRHIMKYAGGPFALYKMNFNLEKLLTKKLDIKK